MREKVFKTYEEQIEILEMRGLLIGNENEAKKILMYTNYYKLINGYSKFFFDATGNKYKNGIKLTDIHGLYLFNKDLISMIFPQILELEQNIKSVLAHEFSRKYGHKDYLVMKNFNFLEYSNGKSVISDTKIKKAFKLVTKLNSEIGNAYNETIEHYLKNHGYVPMWVLISVVGLNDIGRMYDLLEDGIRGSIAKSFNLQPNELGSYIKLLSAFRNICAHGDRIYNAKFDKLKIVSNHYHNLLKLKDGKGNVVYGGCDVLAFLIILKKLKPHNHAGKLIDNINETISSLNRKVKCVSHEEILKEMNLPINWYDLKNK